MHAQITALKEVSLSDQACEMIRGAILEGVLKPNERFTIEDMAARLGISRTPVREALKALQGDGLVRLLPHRGAVVERYAHDEIRNRYVIAAMLEGYAAELAAQAEPEELAVRLEANCNELECRCRTLDPDLLDEVRRLAELNYQFHIMIWEASGSPTLKRFLDSLRRPTSFTLNYWKAADGRAASLVIHRKIAAAFRDRDGVKARELLQQHLMEACERVQRHFVEANEAAATADLNEVPRSRPRRTSPAPQLIGTPRKRTISA
jgi:DNA-binding GntR family transcriptional regulator